MESSTLGCHHVSDSYVWNNSELLLGQAVVRWSSYTVCKSEEITGQGHASGGGAGNTRQRAGQ